MWWSETLNKAKSLTLLAENIAKSTANFSPSLAICKSAGGPHSLRVLSKSATSQVLLDLEAGGFAA